MRETRPPATRPRVTARIDHVQLPVADLQEASQWYQEFLGFKPDYANDEFVILQLGDGPRLFLWLTGDQTTANFTRSGAPWPALAFEVANVNALHEQLRARGVKVAVFENDGVLTVTKFYDPFGNMLAAFQYNEQRAGDGER